MSGTPVLLTHRLRLRPIQRDDAAALFTVFGDPEAMRYWDKPCCRTLAGAAQLIRSFAVHEKLGCCNWAVTYRNERRPVGLVRLVHTGRANRQAELHFILARPHWGQGLMSEALKRVLDHVFIDLGLNRIEVGCQPEDARGRATLNRLRFVDEGTLRQKLFVDPCYRDLMLFALLRSDWLSLHGATSPRD